MDWSRVSHLPSTLRVLAVGVLLIVLVPLFGSYGETGIRASELFASCLTTGSNMLCAFPLNDSSAVAFGYYCSTDGGGGTDSDADVSLAMTQLDESECMTCCVDPGQICILWNGYVEGYSDVDCPDPEPPGNDSDVS